MMNKRTYGLLLLLAMVSNGFAEKAKTQNRKVSTSEVILKILLGGDEQVKNVSPRTRKYIEKVFDERGLSDTEKVAMFEINNGGMQSLNAAAGKLIFFPEMIFLLPLVADMLEKSVISQEEGDEYYTLNIRMGRSPYSFKLKAKNSAMENMVRAVLEHECGHLYHKHYEKFSLKDIALQATAISLFWYLISLDRKINNHNEKVDKTTYQELTHVFNRAEEYQNTIIVSLITVFVGFPIVKALFKGEYQSSVEKEWEADSFVTDDVDRLKGAARFFMIIEEMMHYIYSYESQIIRFYAWKQEIEPHEFYAQNKIWCQRWVFSSWINQSHPIVEDRIQKFKERIAFITDQKFEDVVLQDRSDYTLDVYHDGEIIAAL